MTSPFALAACAGLLLLGAACGVALAQDARGRRLDLRLADRVRPLAPAAAPPRSLAGRLGLADALAALRRRGGWLFGYRDDRAAAYPLRAPLLLLPPGGLALVLARMLDALLGLPPVLSGPLLWIGLSRALFAVLHARHADRLYRQFPDALAMIVRSVRAGIPLHEALRVVARESLEPTAGQFARIVDQMAIGIRLDEALRDTAARTGVSEYAFFTVALTLQAQTGGSLAETLENLAEVIRKRVALRMRAIALASEARTSAYVLAALPVVTGLVLSVIDFDYLRPLFETRFGNRLLLAAVFLLALGGATMRMLIQRSLR